MKTTILKTLVIVLFVTILKVTGQGSYPLIVVKKFQKQKTTYVFKNYKEKELKVYRSYLKLYYNMNDRSYPKELLNKDKKEFIEILKGKIAVQI